MIAALYRRLLEQCPGLEGVEVPPRMFDAEVLYVAEVLAASPI